MEVGWEMESLVLKTHKPINPVKLKESLWKEVCYEENEGFEGPDWKKYVIGRKGMEEG